MAVLVHLHRMVDDQFRGLQRVDLAGLAPQLDDRVAHGRQVDDAGDAGEVLHEDARGPERYLLVRDLVAPPGGQRDDVVAGYGEAVLVSEQVFEQDADRVGEPADVADAGPLQRFQAEDIVGAVPDLQLGTSAKGIELCHFGPLSGLSTRGSGPCLARIDQPSFGAGSWRKSKGPSPKRQGPFPESNVASMTRARTVPLSPATPRTSGPLGPG